MPAMYRQNALPPPPDPKEVARQAAKNCAMIQIGIAVMHTITLSLLVLHFAFYKPPAQLGIPTDLVHEWRLAAFVGAIGYVALFGSWGALNAWGLGKRSRVAHWSSILFAAATMATCCAAPFGGFLLFLLLRKDVKAHFG